MHNLGFHLHVSRRQFTTQLLVGLQRENETGACLVDGGKLNRLFGRFVSYLPNRAAVFRAVGSGADIREVGNIFELGEFPDEALARSEREWVISVVVHRVVKGFVRGDDGSWTREVVLVIQSRARLMGGRLMTCLWHGTSDMREKERDDKCSGEDHCERDAL